MLFVCDIGNSTIKIGVYNQDKLMFKVNFASVDSRTPDELTILLSGAFSMNNISPSEIDGAVISSVVRPLTSIAAIAIQALTQVKPLIVGPGVKTGLNLKTDIPSQLGADIVVNAVAAQGLSSLPQVVVAMGTATTLTGINARGEVCGVLIAPGVGTSFNSLALSAAELPRAALSEPTELLGKNTLESMISGVVYGNSSMLDGLLDRIAAEWETDELNVVITGLYAEAVLPYMESKHHLNHEPDLILCGLKKIYQLNTRRA